MNGEGTQQAAQRGSDCHPTLQVPCETMCVIGTKQENPYVGLSNKAKSDSEVAQSCPTLCNPMDCSPPGFSIHGIFQARTLEWVAIAFSRGSS